LLENVRNLKSHNGGETFRIIKQTIEEELGYSFHEQVVDARTLVPQKRTRCFMVCFRDKDVDFKFPSFAGEPKTLKSILEPEALEKYTISDRLWAGHVRRTKNNLDRGTGFTAFEANIDAPANTLVARYGKDGKECLIPQEGKNPRKLTPLECARLQGFPDKYALPDSDAAAYRQFGNSVPVPVVKLIARRIVKTLDL
jgi:DNA (cytosine-5)-methyltransferase 1